MMQETAAKPPSKVFSIHGGGGKPSSTVGKNPTAPPTNTTAAKPQVMTPKPTAAPKAKAIDRRVPKVNTRVTVRRR